MMDVINEQQAQRDANQIARSKITMNYVISALLLFILLLPACNSTYDQQAYDDKQIVKLTKEIKIHEKQRNNVLKAISKANLSLAKTESLEEQEAIIDQLRSLLNMRENALYNITWKKDRIRKLRQGR